MKKLHLAGSFFFALVAFCNIPLNAQNLHLYKIRQIRVQDPVTGIADSAGSKYAFYLKGIATSPGSYFSMIDSTGAIFVDARNSNNSSGATIGDSVFIRGVLVQRNGVTIVNADSVSLFNISLVPLLPKVVRKLDESLEAELVKVSHIRLVDLSQWPSGNNFNVYPSVLVTDSGGKDTFRIYFTGGYPSMPPGGLFNVTGIVSQDKASPPYIGGYILLVRNLGDLLIPPIKLYKIRDVKGYNSSTGVADSIKTGCILKGIMICNILSLGSLSQPYYEFAIKDSTGSITVTWPTNIAFTVLDIGDSIEVHGYIMQSDGLTYLITYSMQLPLYGFPHIIPQPVDILNESVESELVTVSNCYIPNKETWTKGGIWNRGSGYRGSGIYFGAYRGKDTINVEIPTNTDIYTLDNIEPGYYDITGIVDQEDTAKPYLHDYYLMPRSMADFSHSSGIQPQNNLKNAITLYPNPVQDNLFIASSTKIDTVEIVDMIGKRIETQIVGSGVYKMDLSALTPGVYIIKINSGNNSIYKKIVKD